MEVMLTRFSVWHLWHLWHLTGQPQGLGNCTCTAEVFLETSLAVSFQVYKDETPGWHCIGLLRAT